MPRIFARIALIVSAVLASSLSNGTTIIAPPVPEEMLDHVGFKRDLQSLISYLEHGFPPEFIPLETAPFRVSPFMLYRFHFYAFAIDALKNFGDPQAVPVLHQIQSGDFPSVMLADLDVHVASNDEILLWEEWDMHVEIERNRLALQAAIAIHSLSGESPLPFMESLLAKRTPASLNVIKNERLQRRSFDQFAEIFRNLTRYGSLTGIDALISLLDSPTASIRLSAAQILRLWTREWFGPYPDSPLHTNTRDVEAWKNWWTAQRPTAATNGFFIDSMQRRMPEGVTLYDHLWISVEGSWSEGSGDRSREWLEEHSRNHLDELRAIATNTSERLRLREQALFYLIQPHKRSLYKLLIRCLRDTSVAIENPLYGTALRLIHHHYKNHYIDVLKKCIDEEWPAAPHAVAGLAEDSKGREYLWAKLPTMPDNLRLQFVNEQLSVMPPALAIVELALAGDDPQAAARALRAARYPQIAPNLSIRAQEHIQKWEKNSWCGLYLITPDVGFAPEDYKIAVAAQQPGPPAAAVFAITMIRVGGAKATKDFIRAVEDYRVSRGRTDTLAELGFK